MQKKWSEKQRAGFLIELTDSGMNPMKLGYQLDEQRLNQNSQMFDIDLALNKIGLNRAKFGLTDSDSAFLRVLAQMWNGTEKGSNSMMPYVIGEKATDFVGDVVKNAIPKLPWQRYKFDVNPFKYDKRGLRYWK